MHAVANVHGTIQIGRGLGLPKGRAGDLVSCFVHDSTIHGFEVCAHFVCH